MQKSSFMISTDLDGTLLDHHSYSWQPASEALEFVKQKGIPVVINTSKTAEEVISLQQGMGITDPFIVENGSAVFIHNQDERFDSAGLLEHGEWRYAILGESRSNIITALQFVRTEFNWTFSGFNDLSVDDVAELTGLPDAGAQQAKDRQFSEPLQWQDSDANLQTFKVYLADKKLTLLKGGRFYHVLGDTNKGAAIKWLQQRMTTDQMAKLIALGDSDNDLDMLSAADYPVLVKSPSHDFPQCSFQGLIKTKKLGPIGWNEEIIKLTKINDGGS